jgi:tryptophan 2,3-dioxygenase
VTPDDSPLIYHGVIDPVNRPDSADAALLDLSGRLSYGEYLQLDSLLAAQQPRTEAHDEMLFIVQHQTTELWFRLVLHELEAAMAGIDRDDLGPVFKNLARVERIFRVLIDAWEILSTMTPADYMEFRHALDAASGFQSHQYRLLEFALGNRDPVYLRPFAHRHELHAELTAALESPSLYDRTIALLARRGLPIAATVLDRDVRLSHVPHPSVAAAWREVYRHTDTSWDLYELAEELVDLEDTIRQWRFRHVTTVQRIIGAKPGTGGTSGVGYLKERLAIVLFPELWEVRTDL